MPLPLPPERAAERPAGQRRLGLGLLVALVVGSILGSGIFGQARTRFITPTCC